MEYALDWLTAAQEAFLAAYRPAYEAYAGRRFAEADLVEVLVSELAGKGSLMARGDLDPDTAGRVVDRVKALEE